MQVVDAHVPGSGNLIDTTTRVLIATLINRVIAGERPGSRGGPVKLTTNCQTVNLTGGPINCQPSYGGPKSLWGTATV